MLLEKGTPIYKEHMQTLMLFMSRYRPTCIRLKHAYFFKFRHTDKNPNILGFSVLKLGKDNLHLEQKITCFGDF